MQVGVQFQHSLNILSIPICFLPIRRHSSEVTIDVQKAERMPLSQKHAKQPDNALLGQTAQTGQCPDVFKISG